MLCRNRFLTEPCCRSGRQAEFDNLLTRLHRWNHCQRKRLCLGEFQGLDFTLYLIFHTGDVELCIRSIEYLNRVMPLIERS